MRASGDGVQHVAPGGMSVARIFIALGSLQYGRVEIAPAARTTTAVAGVVCVHGFA